ncbi:hypothetical protein ABRZ24_21475, partial [Brenneria populi]|nr:hypothetical protein [Brenneria populi Li et al. 2015]
LIIINGQTVKHRCRPFFVNQGYPFLAFIKLHNTLGNGKGVAGIVPACADEKKEADNHLPHPRKIKAETPISKIIPRVSMSVIMLHRPYASERR